MPRILGDRIMLREYKEDDFSKIREWVNNPEVTKYLSDIFLYPQSEKETREFLEKAMGKDWKGFVIADVETGDFIGQVDFVDLDLKNGTGELGIVIGDLEKQNQGFGTEALELFLDFGFNQLRLNRVELSCWEHNKRAQKVYERLGFKREGIKRNKWYRDGQYFDEYCYGILRSEWEKI